MKLMICIFGLAALCTLAAATEKEQPDRIVRLEHSPDGFWTKKLTWKPRWVKSWQPKTIYVAHWRKTWGPVQVKEWVPIPKPPPGWTKPHTVEHVHHHHKIPVPVTHLRPYAPAHPHVDLVPHHHHESIIHSHKPLNLVHPEGLHFHAAPGAHYGPAFHHGPHHEIVPHHHDHHHPEVAPHHELDHHLHHHEHLDHPLAHEHNHIINPNAESFSPHFLPLSTEHLKIK